MLTNWRALRYWWPSAMLAAVWTLYLIGTSPGSVAPWVQWAFAFLCAVVGFLNIPAIPAILALQYFGSVSPWVGGACFWVWWYGLIRIVEWLTTRRLNIP